MTGETPGRDGELARCDWPEDEVEVPRPRPGGWADRLGHKRWLPEVIGQRRASILEYLDEVGRPEPGRSEVPGWRKAWARGVSVPIKIAARAAEDASEKPERLGPAVVLLLLLCTGLNQVPIIGAFIPYFMDITTWF
jgi:hypothetical protein